MFNLLRQMERWLHQHIFKLGWLLTRDFYITTILYYTFFLPGIVVYEVVYWLIAGVLDVRADRAIAIPEKQEIGELRLSFVKLSRKTPPHKLAIINMMPLVAGLALIWLIVFTVFDITTLAARLAENTGGILRGLSIAVEYLVSRPDFWLWSYLVFTIANTMMPDTTIVREWWWVVAAVAVVCVLLLILGAGDVIGDFLSGPVATGLNALSGIFGIIIMVDLIAVAGLGSAEALFEWATGHSATFKNGKMIVMTRAEAAELRKQEREKARGKQRKTPTIPSEAGLPSVYKLSLPVPGPPGQEPVTQTIATVVEAEEQQEPAPQRPIREEPSVVSGSATHREMRINIPGRDRSDEDISEDVEDDDDEPPDDDELIYEDVEDSV